MSWGEEGWGKGHIIPLKSILMVKKLSETNERKAGAAPGKSANIFIRKKKRRPIPRFIGQ
jgi:hypothetical protein